MKNTHKILSLACLLTVSNPSLLFSKHEVILPLASEGGYVTLEQTSPTTIRRAKITRVGEEYQTLHSSAPTLKMLGANSSIYNQTEKEYKKQCSSQPKNEPQKVAHLISMKEGKGYDWYVLKKTGSVIHAFVSPNPEASRAELWNREGKYQAFPAGDNDKLLSAAEDTFLKECLHLRPWHIQWVNSKRKKTTVSAIDNNISKRTQPRKWARRWAATRPLISPNS